MESKGSQHMVSLRRRIFGGSDRVSPTSSCDDALANSSSRSSSTSPIVSTSSDDDGDLDDDADRSLAGPSERMRSQCIVAGVVTKALQAMLQQEAMCRVSVEQLEVRLRHRLFTTLSQWIAELIVRLKRVSSASSSTAVAASVITDSTVLPVPCRKSAAASVVCQTTDCVSATLLSSSSPSAKVACTGRRCTTTSADPVVGHQVDGVEGGAMPCGVSDKDSPRESEPSVPYSRNRVRTSASAQSLTQFTPRVPARSTADAMHRVWCEQMSLGICSAGRARPVTKTNDGVSASAAPATMTTTGSPLCELPPLVSPSSPNPYRAAQQQQDRACPDQSTGGTTIPLSASVTRRHLSVQEAHDLYFSSIQVVESFEVRQQRQQLVAERIAVQLHERQRRQIAWELSTLTTHRQQRSRLSLQEVCVRWYVTEEAEVAWLAAMELFLDGFSALVSQSALADAQTCPPISLPTTPPFRRLQSTRDERDDDLLLPSAAFSAAGRGDAVSSVQWMREGTRVVRMEQTYRERVLLRSESVVRRHLESSFIAQRWAQHRLDAMSLLSRHSSSDSFNPPSSTLRALSTRCVAKVPTALDESSSRSFRQWVSESCCTPPRSTPSAVLRIPSAIALLSSTGRRFSESQPVVPTSEFSTPTPPMVSPVTSSSSHRVVVPRLGFASDPCGSADACMDLLTSPAVHRRGTSSPLAPLPAADETPPVDPPQPMNSSSAMGPLPGFFLCLGASSALPTSAVAGAASTSPS